MRLPKTTMAAVALFLCVGARSEAGIIVNLAGDKDSFGTGKPDGSTVSVNEILVPGGEDGDFDRWALSSFSWTHNYVVPAGETIVAAFLRIVTLDMEDNGAGDGLGGAPYDDLLFLDGVELGGAFDDVFTADATAATQITPNASVFDLTAFLPSLADGSLSVRINPLGGRLGDAIAVDYAELTVVTAPVPEPATATLMALGLGAAAWRRRKAGSR
jgi:PEP-CTERM motif